MSTEGGLAAVGVDGCGGSEGIDFDDTWHCLAKAIGTCSKKVLALLDAKMFCSNLHPTLALH